MLVLRRLIDCVLFVGVYVLFVRPLLEGNLPG